MPYVMEEKGDQCVLHPFMSQLKIAICITNGKFDVKQSTNGNKSVVIGRLLLRHNLSEDGGFLRAVGEVPFISIGSFKPSFAI